MSERVTVLGAMPVLCPNCTTGGTLRGKLQYILIKKYQIWSTGVEERVVRKSRAGLKVIPVPLKKGVGGRKVSKNPKSFPS